MKKMILITLIIAGFVVYTVWQTSTYKNSDEVEKLLTTLKSESCSNEPPRENIMLSSKLADIRRLGELEGLCNSRVTNVAYNLITVPNSSESAKVQAAKLAENILEYKEYDMKPVIFMELSTTWKNSDFNNLASGAYDKYLTEFFGELSNAGIKEEQIYGWVIAPRPNLPLWGKTFIDPVFFPKYYNAVSRVIKESYTKPKMGVYFSASTYEGSPIDWSERDYRSLAPYFKGINPEDVEIIGIEGYPWLPAINKEGSEIMAPAEYLPKTLVQELQALTNFKDLIIGTGTFAAMYSEVQDGKVIVPAEVRKEVLDSTVTTVKQYSNKGYNVLVFLNASDERTTDGTDWSYFGTQFTENQLHQKVLLDFLRQLNKANIKVLINF